jgi:hypothetical protein
VGRPVLLAGKTLIGTQAAVELWDGRPAGSPGEFKYDVATEAMDRGFDLFALVGKDGLTYTGKRWLTYDGGHTTTFALNLARSEVARWFAAKLVKHFGWADGWHCDYFGPPGWIGQKLYAGPVGGEAFWWQYQAGLNRTIHEFRGLRGNQPTTVIGQQWHNMRGQIDMIQLNGRFVEVRPWLWGTYPWQAFHQAQLDAFASYQRYWGAGAPQHVFELRYPTAEEPIDVKEFLAFCTTNNIVVSWGREQQAGVGWRGGTP